MTSVSFYFHITENSCYKCSIYVKRQTAEYDSSNTCMMLNMNNVSHPRRISRTEAEIRDRERRLGATTFVRISTIKAIRYE